MNQIKQWLKDKKFLAGFVLGVFITLAIGFGFSSEVTTEVIQALIDALLGGGLE